VWSAEENIPLLTNPPGSPNLSSSHRLEKGYLKELGWSQMNRSKSSDAFENFVLELLSPHECCLQLFLQ
jgi:hypothetical protein